MLSLNPLDYTTKKPKQPPDSLLKPNSAVNSAIHHHHPRACLLAAILAVQLLLILHLRSLRHDSAAASLPPSYEPDPCDSGRVFVYDLPESLNRAVLAGKSSDAITMSNSGFGPPAHALSGLVPEELSRAWFWTDQFATEVIFHNRMLSHRCRVSDPAEATAFYVPFYAGLSLAKHLWSETSTAEDKDRDCREMLTWLSNQPYYSKSGGWDHFITMGRISWDFRRLKNRDGRWGSSCIHLPGMRNLTRLLIERNPWDYFDVGVPYPTGFHPRNPDEVSGWQAFVRGRRRPSLFCFAGAARRAFKDDFRGLLLRHCTATHSCNAVDCGAGPPSRCSNGSSSVLEAFLSSEFCLQPRGDSFTRRSIFDCMVAGAIPVFFWKRTAYRQYEWFLPAEHGSYSVYIDRNAVKNGTASVKAVLESYSVEEKRKMREKVIEYIPRMIYSLPDQGLGTVKDAFDIALDGVFNRFKDHRDDGFKW